MNKSGYTLVEVMISTALLVTISMLGFATMQSASRSLQVNQAMALVEADARHVMMALSRELEFAVKPAPTGESLPPGVQGLRIHDNNRAVTFQTPRNAAFTTFSAPITLRHVTEDLPQEEYEFGNAVLDPDEDLNGDGVLNRLASRTQSGETLPLGGANTVADLRFELLNGDNAIRVSIVTTTRIAPPQNRLVRHTLESDIFLMN